MINVNFGQTGVPVGSTFRTDQADVLERRQAQWSIFFFSFAKARDLVHIAIHTFFFCYVPVPLYQPITNCVLYVQANLQLPAPTFWTIINCLHLRAEQ